MLKSISHLKIHHLHQAGLSNTAIAVQVGCSIRTVYPVLKGPPPTADEIAAGSMTRVLPQGRPSVVMSEHSLAQVAITTERRKKMYAMRQHLFDMGPAAISFCEVIIMLHPGNGWFPDSISSDLTLK